MIEILKVVILCLAAISILIISIALLIFAISNMKQEKEERFYKKAYEVERERANYWQRKTGK